MNLQRIIIRYPKLFSSAQALFWLLQLAFCIFHLELKKGETRGMTQMAVFSLLFTNLVCLVVVGISLSAAFAPSQQTTPHGGLGEDPFDLAFALYLVGAFFARVLTIQNANSLTDLALGAELVLVIVALVVLAFYAICWLIVKFFDGLVKEVVSEPVRAPEPAPEPKPERLSRHVEAGILVALNDMRRTEYNYGARTLFVKRREYYANTDVINILCKLASNLTYASKYNGLAGDELRIDWSASAEQDNVSALAKLGYTLRYEEERAYLDWNGDEQREATATPDARRDNETCSAE